LDALAAVIRDRYHTGTAAERLRMTTLQMQAAARPLYEPVCATTSD